MVRTLDSVFTNWPTFLSLCAVLKAGGESYGNGERRAEQEPLIQAASAMVSLNDCVSSC